MMLLGKGSEKNLKILPFHKSGVQLWTCLSAGIMNNKHLYRSQRQFHS